MPIYEYVCKRCNHRFEVLTAFWNGKCPNCQSTEVERRFSRLNWRLGNYFQSLKDDGLDA